MTKRWAIRFSDKAEKEFGKLDKSIQKRIRYFLEKELCKMVNPRQRGHQLMGNLSKYWRYRVGDYRLICSIKDTELTIWVVHAGHRREIYH